MKQRGWSRELEGFDELIRRISLKQVPTAILSGQTAGTRGKYVIVNLLGRPSAIDICLNDFAPLLRIFGGTCVISFDRRIHDSLFAWIEMGRCRGHLLRLGGCNRDLR